MTATPTLETLAREFSARVEHIQNALEMIDAGLSAPFIGRFRRAQVGGLSESMIRRLGRRRQELEDLDRRRGTILRLFEKEPNLGESTLNAIRTCMDRFELEDLFIPHRRPEPEVQLAIDRGLGALADLLVAPVPKSERASIPGMEEGSESDVGEDGDGDDDDGESAHKPLPDAQVENRDASGERREVASDSGSSTLASDSAGAADAVHEPGLSTTAALVVGAAAIAGEASAETPTEAPADISASAPATSEDSTEEADEHAEVARPAPTLDAPPTSHTHIDLRAAMNAQLARVCQPFVRPDKGIHTEAEALSGALRILSDRLGRDARLRGSVRRMLAKHGVLSVRATVDESRIGRNKSLLKIRQPLRQIQGHRLLAIRQAQKERVLNTVITIDPEKVMPKVRAALGRHIHPAHVEVLNEVALQALTYRLIPMVEQDVRLELKERADFEALRFLSQHLRQILFTPPLGGEFVAGVDVNAKGDWTIVLLDPDGAPIPRPLPRATEGSALPATPPISPGPLADLGVPVPPVSSVPRVQSISSVPSVASVPSVQSVPSGSSVAAAGESFAGSEDDRSGTGAPVLPSPPSLSGPPIPPGAVRSTSHAAPANLDLKIEVGDKDPATLGAELKAVLESSGVRFIAVGHGKGPRAAVNKMRAALRAVNYNAWVLLVNEAGLSSYANSEFARSELEGRAVPARMAISLARRLQDPLSEILKVDPRHLGLGTEQGLVSKANARRAFVETIESCTAHVGCDINRAPLSFLQHLPGIDRETARKIVARRAEKPFQSREELRVDGLLTEAQWTSAIAFLRVYRSSEPLDATSLHPEQYPLVRRLLDSAGSSVEQGFGHPGSTKGLRRFDFDIDEGTWRDLMREISFPGRDPRFRYHLPNLLESDTDPVRLTKDRVVEGVISNVASFGTFVDVGLPQDAMVHISEISDRYVRDARELLSIGQVVRARILDASGQRLSLSLKNVPREERDLGRDRPRQDRGRRNGPPREGREDREGVRSGGDRAPRSDGGDRGPRRGRGREDRGESKPNVRAAQSRRDGLAGRSGGRGDRRGGPGQRGGPRRPGEGDDRGDRGERVRLDTIDTGKKPAFSPFASFFKGKKDEKSPEQPAG